MTEPNPTPKPRRLYPRRKPAARPAGAASAEAGLQDEIDMLRESIRLLGELAAEEQSPAKKARILDVQGRQIARLGVLLKTKRQLDERQDDLTGTLNQAIAEVIEELRQKGKHG